MHNDITAGGGGLKDKLGWEIKMTAVIQNMSQWCHNWFQAIRTQINCGGSQGRLNSGGKGAYWGG